MATDAALLSVGVKTEGATQATTELKNLADQAGKTEAATKKMGSTFDGSKSSTSALNQNVQGVQSSLSNMAGPMTLVTVGAVALAAAFAAVKFAQSIGDAIAFAASLKDIHEKTGANVQSLQRIAPAAAIAGVSFQAVEQSLTLMGKGMSGVDDKSSGLGKALATLGISARDSNGKLKDTGTLFEEIAQQMAKHPDSAAKVGVAMAAMGRSGAEMNKVFAAMAEAQQFVVAATDEQVEAADRYQDNLTKLSLAGGAFAKIIGHEVAPVLADFTDVLLDVAMGAGGAKDTLAGLAKDGSIRTWAQQAALWVAEVIDVFDALGRVAQILWKALATGVAQTMEMFTGLGSAMKLALQGNFSGAADAAKASFDKMKGMGNQFVGDFDAIASRAQFSTLLKAKFAETNAATKETKDSSDKLGLSWKDADQKAAKYAEDMTKLIRELEDGNAKLKMESEAINKTKLERELDNLALERAKALRQDELKLKQDVINKLFDEREAILRTNDARRQEKERIEESVKAYIKAEEQASKNYDAQLQMVRGIQDQNKELEFQIKTFGKSKLEVDLYTIAIKKAEIANADLAPEIKASALAALDQQEALLKTADAQEKAKVASDEWAETLKQADAVGYDFFQAMGDGMEGIKDWARNAGEALKKYLLAVLYEMTAKPFVVSIMTSIGGALGIPGAANASGGGLSSILGGSSGGSNPLGSLFSGNSPLSSLGSMFGGTLGVPGGAAGSFAVSSMGEALGLSTAMGAGEGAVLTGLGSGLIAAIPWAGLAAMAIPLIMSFFDDGPAMRSGTFASGAASQGGNPLFSGSSSFGEFGVVNDKWFSDSDMGAEMGAFMEGIKGIDNALAEIIGKDLTGQVKLALESVATEFEAGIEGEAVTFGSIMKERYIAVFAALDVRLGEVVEGFSGTGEELAKFVITLGNVYMMVEDMPARVGNTLLDVMAAGILTIEEIGRFATAYVGLQEVMALDPVAFVLDQMSEANVTAYDKVVTLRGGLEELLKSYDGSVAGTEELYGATMSYVQAQIVAVAQIQEVKKAVSEMFSESRTLIADFFLSNADKAAKLMDDAREYQKLLNETLDPKLIQDYSKIINDDLMKAFQLLSPEEQKAQQQSFLQRIDEADALAKERLRLSGEAITQSGEDQLSIMASIRDALAYAAQSMVDAAAAIKDASADMKDAGQDQVRAANTPVQVDVAPITVDSYVYVDYGPGGG